MSRSGAWIGRIAAVAATVLAIGVGVAAPAAAVPGGPEVSDPAAPSTEATIVALRDTSGLFGGTVPGATALTPYPSSGLQDQRSVTTAQIVLDDPHTVPVEQFVTYCIDLDTETEVGIHYELGDWNSDEVPNLPYVQWILQNYYPANPAAPVAGTAAEKVRAVQGAIWYFTDQFVVSRFYPTQRDAVRAIVEAAQAAVNPTPVPPPLPALTITPASLDGDFPDQIVGPFVIGGDVASATIEVPGNTEVYSDAAGTVPVLDGESVEPGDQLWARYDPADAGQGFSVNASATMQSGNVFVYDGNNPPRTTAQELILAADAIVPIRASASLTPVDAGTLQVDVTIAGAAAGDQGRIDLTATCSVGAGDWTYARPIQIPAGTPPSTVAIPVPDIPAGATCTVTEQDDGGNAYAIAAPPVIGPPVTIASDTTSTIAVTNSYSVPPPATGALRVEVTIAGPAAGAQSALELVATCASGADSITRDIAVAAGITGTTPVAMIDDLPAGAVCSVAERVDGRNADAEFVSSTVSPPSVTIASDATSVITVTDTYAVPVPPTGTLRVDVTIAGAAAGEQSALALTATCTLDDATTSHAIAVPAGVTGTTTAATFADVPIDSECVVSQTANGSNEQATLSSSAIVPPAVVIRDGTTSTVTVTNTYAVPVPQTGTLRVDVTIAGAAAGEQSTIVLVAACTVAGDTTSHTITVPARATGTRTAATFVGVPADSECVVSQTVNGSNAQALLSSSAIDPPSVVIAEDTTSAITVTDTYALPPSGTLRVDVTIAGAAAGEQSALALTASCTADGDTTRRGISVPAGVTGTTTVATIPDLPVDAECAVTQTVDGGNAQAVLSSSTIDPASVVIADGVTSAVTVTDTYAVPVPPTGSLRVDVTIAGEAAGEQSALALTATCTLDDDALTHDIPVAAGITGTTTVATLTDLPVDAECVVAQTADGANARATLSSSAIAPASVVIREGMTSVVTVTDAYAAAAPVPPDPTPTPTPSPSPSALPATGGGAPLPWGIPAVLVLAGGAILAVALVRRRSARG